MYPYSQHLQVSNLKIYKNTLIELLCISLTKISYVAAKTHYFGVGGGTTDFTELVNEEGVFSIKVCKEFTEGLYYSFTLGLHNNVAS